MIKRFINQRLMIIYINKLDILWKIIGCETMGVSVQSIINSMQADYYNTIKMYEDELDNAESKQHIDIRKANVKQTKFELLLANIPINVN